MARSSGDDSRESELTARDIEADARDDIADTRERLEDVREGVLDRWERELTERAQALRMLDGLDLGAQTAAGDRRVEARSLRSALGEQRRAAAIERDIDRIHSTPSKQAPASLRDASAQRLLDLTYSLVVDASTPAAAIEGILAMATETLGDAAAVTISLPVEGQVKPAAATAVWATDLDAAQFARQSGPIVDALDTGGIIVSDDLASDGRWHSHQSWGPDARRGVVSVPFTIGDAQVGGLTVYAHAGVRYDPHSLTAAALLAGQASLAVQLNIERLDQTQLSGAWERALDSRDEIGQAKGILMGLQKVSGETAFDLIRAASQRHNIKVRQVAEHVIAHHRLPEGIATESER